MQILEWYGFTTKVNGSWKGKVGKDPGGVFSGGGRGRWQDLHYKVKDQENS
jgi:hypothetical protein